MGQPEQFAKDTFAMDLARLGGGAFVWEDPPEIRLEKVQSDGYLHVVHPERLAFLPAPWSQARRFREAMLEIKMPGDHFDAAEVERALFRRQARQVQRVEETSEWPGDLPLWLVAPHLPGWVGERRKLARIAPGCYRFSASAFFPFLWIAANELPLADELVPFLVARSGRALDEFARWVAPRRRRDWVLRMIRYTSMSTTTRDDLTKLLEEFSHADTPEIAARDDEIMDFLLRIHPQKRRTLVDEGRQEGRQEGRREGHLSATRAALRRVLTRRGWVLDAATDARIEACADLDTLARWHEQAVTAANADEALR